MSRRYIFSSESVGEGHPEREHERKDGQEHDEDRRRVQEEPGGRMGGRRAIAVPRGDAGRLRALTRDGAHYDASPNDSR